jgi:Tfp pilus assembly protein PilF
MMNPSHLAKAKGIEGNHLFEQGFYEKAITCYRAALTFDPHYEQIHFNCGLAHQALHQLDKALEHFDAAININVSYSDAYINRGNVLRDLNRFLEAKTSYQQAIVIDPDSVQAFNNLGVVCYEMREIPQAIESFLQAIAIEDNHVNAHWGLSLCYLLIGVFEKGWQEFEWRLKDPYFVKQTFPHEYEEYLWHKGQNLKDQTILVMAEQGLGDTIQFCRFTKRLQALGARVVLQVPQTLVELLKHLEGVDQVISSSESAQNIDLVIPLMSIPHRLNLQQGDLGMNQAYLFTNSERTYQLPKEIFQKDTLKVGIVWQGGIRESLPSSWATHHRRNIPLHYFLNLAHPRITFYSLQKGILAEAELKEFRQNHPEFDIHEIPINDFADTATIISELDLVIAVDTAVAHLAGAMGKPVWVLNRFDACWRWLMDRSDTPWYPSMSLYRQTTDGDWAELMIRICKDLEEFIFARK